TDSSRSANALTSSDAHESVDGFTNASDSGFQPSGPCPTLLERSDAAAETPLVEPLRCLFPPLEHECQRTSRPVAGRRGCREDGSALEPRAPTADREGLWADGAVAEAPTALHISFVDLTAP